MWLVPIQSYEDSHKNKSPGCVEFADQKNIEGGHDNVMKKEHTNVYCICKNIE